jgi:cytochrome c oxidase assembly factor CtaG
MSAWHLGEFLPPLAVSAGYGTAYELRIRALAREGRTVERRRRVAFAAGVAIVALVQLPPFDELGDDVLAAHMAQHMLIGDIASFLIVVGLTGPVLAPLLRLSWFRALRPLTNPIAAFAVWALIAYVWRVPLLYEAAIRWDLLHALEHASYLWAGMLLWVALLGPLPKPAWFNDWARLGYVVLVRVTGTVLANVLIFSQTLLYPIYRGRGGSDPLGDQNVAGALMMIEQMLLTIGLLIWLFLRFTSRDERRQQLLDLADAQGVPLSGERAARAAAAGTTERLRERILAQQPTDVNGPRP